MRVGDRHTSAEGVKLAEYPFGQSTRESAHRRRQNVQIQEIPRIVLTCTALNSFVTTVATPRKNVGLDLPSIWWLYPLTSIKAPFWSATFCAIPDGYISRTLGKNTAEVFRMTGAERSPEVLGRDIEVLSNSIRSSDKVRGYVLRSS